MKDTAFYCATSEISENAAENRKIAYERMMAKNQFILLHNLSLSEPAQNATLQGGTFYASSDRSRLPLGESMGKRMEKVEASFAARTPEV